jgi:hypothetical protein
LIEIFRRYPSDFGPSDYSLPESQWKELEHQKVWVDEWGCRWEERYDGIQGQPKGFPLEDWGRLEAYALPYVKPASGERFEEARARVEERKKEYFVIGGGDCFFERLQRLRGYSSLLFDLVEGRPEISVLADRLLEHNLAVIDRSLRLGVDAIGFSDDWGTQRQLMISPALWREFFKPRYKKMFDLVHSAGALVSFHSDGMILEIVPDFIEIGVDILNPQFSCMDLRALAALTKGRICVRTDIDRQFILPFGTPEEVRAYVREVAETLGDPCGGLIWQGEIGPDVPLANVEAMFAAFVEFGDYSRQREPAGNGAPATYHDTQRAT